ncbi:hypothetical protein PILCRDRAFT_77545 [Piloderma croceum F 1598]|uniref:NAD(P)-binding protein n=1 Tax=Piloderma croceum (strain F 1598) TaxID=765440 RepID=A0A0C3F9V7_PILCF|nr:hypothetical protein PILCRDRAFT_77545 [Piloderma croceum F 1598]
MPSLSSARASNAAFSPPNLPTALFVGGTSGIGQATAQALARSTNGNAHIIIYGRNRSAAESTIASFPKSPQSQYEFVECDVSLLKNVHTTTSELLTKIPKLNFIVLSPGYLTSKFKDREDTSEGLPKKLVTDYYARWKFIYELLPLLKKAKEAGEDAKVLSVLAAGKGKPIDLEDLGMEKEYTLLKEMGNAATYNDLMIESFATLEPTMSFTHIYPGIVRTPIFHPSPSSYFLRLLYPLWYILSYFFSFSPKDSGEYHLYALLAGEKGSFRRGPKGEVLKEGEGYFGTEDARKRLWEHTIKVTEAET